MTTTWTWSKTKCLQYIAFIYGNYTEERWLMCILCICLKSNNHKNNRTFMLVFAWVLFCLWNSVFTFVIVLVTKCICALCNVFVLLYSVCHSVSALSCVDVIQHFMCYYFGHHKKMWRERERKCEATPTASCRYTIRKENEKRRTSGCNSFVVAYFQPAEEPLAVTHLLLPTSNLLVSSFHWLFIIMSIFFFRKSFLGCI